MADLFLDPPEYSHGLIDGPENISDEYKRQIAFIMSRKDEGVRWTNIYNELSIADRSLSSPTRKILAILPENAVIGIDGQPQIAGGMGIIIKYGLVSPLWSDEDFSTGSNPVHEGFTGLVLINKLIAEERARGEEPLFVSTLGFSMTTGPNPFNEEKEPRKLYILYIEKLRPTYVTLLNWYKTKYVDINVLKAALRKIFSKFNEMYHRFGFTHYDLNETNVMIDVGTGDVKIIDLETSYFEIPEEFIEGDPILIAGPYSYDTGILEASDTSNWIYDVYLLLLSIYSRTKRMIDDHTNILNHIRRRVQSADDETLLLYFKEYGVSVPDWREFVRITAPSTDEQFWLLYNDPNSFRKGKKYLYDYDREYFDERYNLQIHKLMETMEDRDKLSDHIFQQIKYINVLVEQLLATLLKVVKYELHGVSIDQWLTKALEINAYMQSNYDAELSKATYYDSFVEQVKTLLI